jgi:aryl-alcohol dehydrogenase-like predicted oxidoreductase
MKFTNLGQSGLRVSRVCVGCMSYGAPEMHAWLMPEEEALPILDHCYRNKFNFYDTSNNYSNGISEETLGKAIKKYDWRRGNIVIATKVFGVVGRGLENAHVMSNDEREQAGYINQFGLGRKHIFDSVDASLERLGLDYIDLLQVHRWDPLVTAKEVMKALHDVVATGKVRYIGASSMWAHQFLELQYTARLNGWTEFVSMQNLHNAVYREEEREMFPACQKFGVAGMPWSPVAMGFLTRSVSSLSGTTRGDGLTAGMEGRPWTDSDKKTNAKIEEIAKNRGTSMAIVAIAWSLSKPFIHSPIVGLSSKKRADEAIEAMTFKLTDEEIKAIDELYEIHEIMGHE